MLRLALIVICLSYSVNGFFKPGMATPFLKGSALKMSDLNMAAMPTVEEWLDVADPKLKKATLAMFRACKEIAYKIRTASCDKMACFNEFGDEQLAIDILANNVIFDNLKASGAVATASSEETPAADS